MLLDPERILKDTNQTESRLMIRKLKELAAAQIPLYKATVSEYDENIRHSSLTDVEKSIVFKGLGKSRAKISPFILEQFTLQVKIMDEYEKALEILLDKDKWTYENKKLSFKSPVYLNQYNQHIDQLNKYESQIAKNNQKMSKTSDDLRVKYKF